MFKVPAVNVSPQYTDWAHCCPSRFVCLPASCLAPRRDGDRGQAGFPPRTSCTGDVRNLPDYGLFREIKAAAFAAEEVARLEAQSR